MTKSALARTEIQSWRLALLARNLAGKQQLDCICAGVQASSGRQAGSRQLLQCCRTHRLCFSLAKFRHEPCELLGACGTGRLQCAGLPGPAWRGVTAQPRHLVRSLVYVPACSSVRQPSLAARATCGGQPLPARIPTFSPAMLAAAVHNVQPGAWTHLSSPASAQSSPE